MTRQIANRVALHSLAACLLMSPVAAALAATVQDYWFRAVPANPYWQRPESMPVPVSIAGVSQPVMPLNSWRNTSDPQGEFWSNTADLQGWNDTQTGGRGGRGGGNMAGLTTNPPEADALQKALDDDAPTGQIKDLLTKFQTAQKAKIAKAKEAEEALRMVLTPRQEATATLLGLLEVP